MSQVAPMEVQDADKEKTGDESKPHITHAQIDGFWIAPPIIEKDLSLGQQARFRVAQLVNLVIVILGLYVTFDSLIGAIASYNNEKTNPSSSNSYNANPHLEFPQLLVCTWGILKANSIKCTLTHRTAEGEPLCYDTDSKKKPWNPAVPESNANHWTKGVVSGATCYDSTSEVAESYDCTGDVKLYAREHFNNGGETCFTINGPSAETPSKIQTKGDLEYPFVSLAPGWQNSIVLSFEHDMSDPTCTGSWIGEAPATTTNTDCYYAQQSYGVYWSALEPSKKVTKADTDATPFILSADHFYMHSMVKTEVQDVDKSVNKSYWLPTSSSAQQRAIVGNSMKYEMHFFYSDLSVETTVIKNAFGTIQVIEAVGGSSGLLLGLSAMTLLSWGMQMCGIRGKYEEPPDAPFPRVYA